MCNDFSFLATAIGSLPHKNIQNATDLIFETIFDAPLCPQLSKLNPKEDMITQYTEHMPGIILDNSAKKHYADLNSDEYFMQLEELFTDYEEVISKDKIDEEIISKYAISEKYYSAFPYFLEKLKQTAPKYVKGQIVGAFTFGTSITDGENKCCFYDETYREVITKTLILKALWQVNEFKKVSPASKPIIFIDEPSLSQLGTSAFMTVTTDDVLYFINETATVLKKFGIIVGMHCCGKADWKILLNSKLDLINFDAFSFSENFSLYADDIKKFLNRQGIIAWGIVPTLDVEILAKLDADNLVSLFENAKNLLLKKGLDEKVILKQSIITPSCGAGSLNIEMAEKAMRLLKEVGLILKSKYEG